MAEYLDEESRTFSEYLLLPNLTERGCVADCVSLEAPITRHRRGEPAGLTLKVPMTSAIMQAVSSVELAVALARFGGLGFIHHNQPVAEQVAMVREVKDFKAGFVVSDTNVSPDTSLADAVSLIRATGHSTVAVTSDSSPTGVLEGLLTSGDFHPDRHDLSAPVATRMRRRDELVCGRAGITLSEANTLIWEQRLDCLPLLDEDNRLRQLVFRSDYEDTKRFSSQVVDAHKRLLVGAGINTHDYRQRAGALIDAGADVLCIDSSDGYSEWQREVLLHCKQEYSGIPIGAGNVVDARAFRFLVDAGADFVKVGIGGGSICITRDQKGIGRGQASALRAVAAARDEHAQRSGEYVPLCSDGGLLLDYHIALALAMGADFVMMGRYFARFDQSPGRLTKISGGYYKEYWGEGSQRARNWRRYRDDPTPTLEFEEGVDGYVPYAGDLYDAFPMTLTKIRATMVSCGAVNLGDFRDTARIVRVSPQSFQENTHDVRLREHDEARLW